VSNSYYLAEGGAQRGPFPVDQLPAQGLRPDTLVWAEGMSQWVRADEVQALQGVLPPVNAWPAPSAPSQDPYSAPGQPPPAAQFIPPAPMPYASPPQYAQPGYGYVPPYNPGDSKRLAAGLCAILLSLVGLNGIHKFILGQTAAGVIMLLVSVVGGIITCGISTGVMSIIALIEGIIYLTKNDQQFYQEYVVQKKQWF
jgi:TM2 domain-containing membrane protein YozV